MDAAAATGCGNTAWRTGRHRNIESLPTAMPPIISRPSLPHLDDPVDRGDVEAAGRHIRAQQDAAVGLAELEEGGGALGLGVGRVGGGRGRGPISGVSWVAGVGVGQGPGRHLE